MGMGLQRPQKEGSQVRRLPCRLQAPCVPSGGAGRSLRPRPQQLPVLSGAILRG